VALTVGTAGAERDHATQVVGDELQVHVPQPALAVEQVLFFRSAATSALGWRSLMASSNRSGQTCQWASTTTEPSP
jgi:hypothetical protein